MQPICRIVSVEPVVLAVAEADLARSQISANIRGMFDIVYSWLKEANVKQVGHNYALYDKGLKDALLVRVGFPVSSTFEPTASVACFKLAAGRAAHAVHVGSYSELHRTYAELESWCKQERLAKGSQSWEVYGDWHNDVSKLETGIYFRLRDA